MNILLYIYKKESSLSSHADSQGRFSMFVRRICFPPRQDAALSRGDVLDAARKGGVRDICCGKVREGSPPASARATWS